MDAPLHCLPAPAKIIGVQRDIIMVRMERRNSISMLAALLLSRRA